MEYMVMWCNIDCKAMQYMVTSRIVLLHGNIMPYVVIYGIHHLKSAVCQPVVFLHFAERFLIIGIEAFGMHTKVGGFHVGNGTWLDHILVRIMTSVSSQGGPLLENCRSNSQNVHNWMVLLETLCRLWLPGLNRHSVAGCHLENHLFLAGTTKQILTATTCLQRMPCILTNQGFKNTL